MAPEKKRWIKNRIKDVYCNGFSGVRRTVHDVYWKSLSDFLSVVKPIQGTNIYEEDWDILLILDACRFDLLQEVEDEFDFITGVDKHTTVGGGSKPWMKNTFIENYSKEIEKTAYVTGNPFSADILDPNDFYSLDEVWRYAWDDELQTIRARPITDRIISTARNENPDRIIGHYMQPHASFVPNPELQEHLGPYERSIWRAIYRGRVSKETVWEAYKENLRYVLEDVRLLLSNVDADKVVITADHGNLIGEWGLYGHGQPPISSLRTVPWIETTGEDDQSYSPQTTAPQDNISADINSRLADLGYVEKYIRSGYYEEGDTA